MRTAAGGARGRLLPVALLVLAGCSDLKKRDLDRATAHDVARACALLASCPFAAADVGPAFAADCVRIGQEILAGQYARYEAFNPTMKRQLACVIDAPDCAALDACLSGGRPRDYCAAHAPLTCDGDVIIDCAAHYSPALLRGRPVMVDCAAQDQICYAVAGRAICTTGASCTGTAERCDGPRLRGCEDNVETIADCRPIFGEDSMCIVEKGEFNCTVRAHPTCESPDSCDGDTAVICRDGRLFRLDCPRVWEGRCGPVPDGGTTCVPDAHDCDAGAPARCDGDALALCINGRYRAIDCASIGMRTCRTDAADGGAGPGRARCVE